MPSVLRACRLWKLRWRCSGSSWLRWRLHWRPGSTTFWHRRMLQMMLPCELKPPKPRRRIWKQRLNGLARKSPRCRSASSRPYTKTFQAQIEHSLVRISYNAIYVHCSVAIAYTATTMSRKLIEEPQWLEF